MFNNLKPILVSGKEVLPIIEGGKGIGVSNGISSGAFAAAGAVGTFSGVNADSYDEGGVAVPYQYKGKTRRERHHELIELSIKGGIAQAKKAYEMASGNGRIHMNILWEMGGTEHILKEILEGAKGLIHGVTCGAGMPYKLAEISAQHKIFYYPIVSSARAFKALWKRSYHKCKDYLGAIVYEDPWRAGGHNGLSNAESPDEPLDPYPRVREIRTYLNEVGLHDTPIIMAGGVWYLREWENWLDNPEIGNIGFQFGTRPLLTKESPISPAWKKKLLNLKEGDVFLNKFSPTGFYSSAVRNRFIQDLIHRSQRQVKYSFEESGETPIPLGVKFKGKMVYLAKGCKDKAEQWLASGFTKIMRTPDDTLVFVTPESEQQILTDQRECMGCLSACNFSSWHDKEETTGRTADPRSFCIQKTLQNIIHSDIAEDELMFAGHNAYRFADDPFFNQGYNPTVKELVERIMTGD